MTRAISRNDVFLPAEIASRRPARFLLVVQRFIARVVPITCAMRDQGFRPATASRMQLIPTCVRELNQPIDLTQGQCRKPLTQFVDRLAKVIAINDSVGRMRVPRTIGCPDTLPGMRSINSHCIQSISAFVVIESTVLVLILNQFAEAIGLAVRVSGS